MADEEIRDIDSSAAQPVQQAGEEAQETAAETAADAQDVQQDAQAGADTEDTAKEAAKDAAKDADDPHADEKGCGSDDNIGTIRIADDVVAMIAAYAAKEVDGVSSMEGGQARDFLDKVGVRSQTKGVKVEVNEHNVKVALSINMGYGYNIPATSSKVQARVKQAIESMTGLHVTDVNVRIAGISIPSEGDVKKD